MRVPNLAWLFNRFRAAGTKGRLDLSLSYGEHLITHLKDHTGYDQGPVIHGKPKKVSPLIVEAQLDGCLKAWVSSLLEWNAGIQ